MALARAWWLLLGAAVACGDGGGTPDAGAIDAGELTCQQLRDAWRAAVEEAGLQCAVAGDCLVVGAPDQSSPCDSGGDNISGDCGQVASVHAYLPGAGPSLEAEWDRRGCVLDGIADCGWVYPRCSSGGECYLAEEPSCEVVDPPPPLSTHSGTIVIAESRIVDHPELGAGASVSIEYQADDSSAIVYDDRWPVGVGCAVYVYDAGTGPELIDEGTVTITGTRVDLPTCTFRAGADRYECTAVAGATAAGDGLAPVGSGRVDVTIASASFDASHVGMHLRIAGADDAAANGTYPIVAYAGPEQITIARSPLSGPTQWSAAAPYAVIAGLGPTEADVDFLGGSDLVSIAKTAGSDVYAFDAEVAAPAGDGIALDADSDPLAGHAIDGSALSFTCDGAGGDCATATAVVVRGRTTTADVTTLASDAMPPADTGSYAVWTCFGFGPDIEIPAAAMVAILATSPTRIELRYLRANVALVGNPGGANPTSLIVGYELIGYTDLP